MAVKIQLTGRCKDASCRNRGLIKSGENLFFHGLVAILIYTPHFLALCFLIFGIAARGRFAYVL